MENRLRHYLQQAMRILHLCLLTWTQPLTQDAELTEIYLMKYLSGVMRRLYRFSSRRTQMLMLKAALTVMLFKLHPTGAMDILWRCWLTPVPMLT
ncbi:hypothetical protein CGRA01v4_12620 [Colletotrichum graminicola]|nr:hypothetical protein CGRA01v4_12620 [Colletotrichum graminicola]